MATVRTVDVVPSREARVGEVTVRRALPTRGRRTVGAWCFADHMGPATFPADRGADIAPHPHIGLQTVTWLFAGELVHRDSLGSEQVVRPGQLNLMTAGHGVAHSEEHTGRGGGELHGIQLWVAQPTETRGGGAAFEHHAALPRVELAHGAATVIVGDLAGTISPARRDTDHIGIELDLRAGTSALALRPDHEHALVVASGAVTVDGTTITPGRLAYLGTGRDECGLMATVPTRAVLIGGAPFTEAILMWWNFVARTRAEITDAHRAWTAADARFAPVASALPRIEVDPPPWSTSS